MQRSKQRSPSSKRVVARRTATSATKARASTMASLSSISSASVGAGRSSGIAHFHGETAERAMTVTSSRRAGYSTATVTRRSLTPSSASLGVEAPIFALPKRFQATDTQKTTSADAVKQPAEATIVGTTVDAASAQEESGFDLDAWEHRLETYRTRQENTLTPKQKQILDEFGESYASLVGPAQVQYNIFNEDPQFTVSKRLIGPPGTIEFPTMVYSPKPYRIVGCNGTVDNPHPLGWFSMEGYLKHMCPTCGQIFQLTNNPDDIDVTFTEKVDNMQHFLGH